MSEDRSISAKLFLAEAAKHLRRGDIVLSRSHTLNSAAIRWVTGSQFSHAALVFFLPHAEQGFNSTFVLESTSRGVGLEKLEAYLTSKSPRSDIVVLRLDGSGFDSEYFKRVRGLMLDHINSGYDHWRVIRLGLSLLFGLRLGWSTLRRGQEGSLRETIARTRRRKYNWLPPEFICSGFIQYGLVKAAERKAQKQAAILKPGVALDDEEGLLAVTPEDIAQSDRVTWRFAARAGRVRPVSSYAEALSFISSGK